jgi:hypothetical protein
MVNHEQDRGMRQVNDVARGNGGRCTRKQHNDHPGGSKDSFHCSAVIDAKNSEWRSSRIAKTAGQANLP